MSIWSLFAVPRAMLLPLGIVICGDSRQSSRSHGFFLETDGNRRDVIFFLGLTFKHFKRVPKAFLYVRTLRLVCSSCETGNKHASSSDSNEECSNL